MKADTTLSDRDQEVITHSRADLHTAAYSCIVAHRVPVAAVTLMEDAC